MSGVFRKLSLLLLLAALLATPALIRHFSRKGSPPANHAAAADRYGFSLEEVSKSAGIHFVHQAPHLDPRLQHIMPQVASMGASVSIVDFDRDGWPDIYVINSAQGSRNHLYRNMHDGTFKDVAQEMGVADLNQPGQGACMGAVWADYDNDGYEDLLVYRWGRPELFHNDAGKHFTRVTEKAGLPAHVNANSAIWFDFDHDGYPDLFIAGYWADDIDLWNLKTTRIMPESFEYAKNGGAKHLLHNNHDGAFTDVTSQSGINSTRWTLACAAADLCGNGYEDLFLANDYGVPELFENQGAGHFREIGKAVNVGFSPKSGMSVSFGDIQNQGCLAIYKTNISEEGVLIQGNDLWLSTPGAAGDNLKYSNLAREMGVELGGWSWGAQFGDFNNDGWLDLFCTNGYVSADRTRSYWYDFSKIAGGNDAIISDAANWPPMKGRSLSGYQQKKLWLNDGAGSFSEVAQAVGATDTFDGRAVAVADLWNRGTLDLIVANQNGPLLIYKNHVNPANHWLNFELEGTTSNRSALGARLTLYFNGMQQVQFVSGGSGFAAQNDRRLHFGVGRDPHVEKAVIRWPSGRVQTLPAPELDKIHHVKEPS